MTGPAFTLRSYGGGVPIGTLAAQMNPGDLSFSLVSAAGWIDHNGIPLGEAGPFTISVDRGLATEEKILCSSVNLVSGLVQVYVGDGISGRGYDGTAANTHNPLGGFPQSGACMVTATAVEAYESNQAANFLFGQSPANNDVPTWSTEEGAPIWGAGGGGGGGGVSEVISPDDSVTVTNPTGPVVELSVNSTGGAGEIVLQQNYNPATPSRYSLVTTVPGSPIALDPANLTYTFNFPATGYVRIQAAMWAQVTSVAGQLNGIELLFTNHLTGGTVAPRMQVISHTGTSGDAGAVLTGRVAYDCIYGNTPGSGAEWDLAYYCPGNDAVLGADDGISGTNYYGPCIVTISQAEAP